jgi:hypothetical protein
MAPLVVGDERCRVRVVDGKSLAHDARSIVITLLQALAVVVAHPVMLRRIVVDVIDVTVGTLTPTRDAGLDHLVMPATAVTSLLTATLGLVSGIFSVSLGRRMAAAGQARRAGGPGPRGAIELIAHAAW